MIFIYICCAFLLRWRSRGSQHKKTGTGSGEPLCGLSEKIIVDDISLAIPQQKMTVLVGANGCGKSTLLSTIARLLQPLGGALLDGKAIHEQPTKAVARQLGILPQSPLLPEGLTVLSWSRAGAFPGKTLCASGATRTSWRWKRPCA
jgi:iron complex transport system ATP-binding protein